MIINIHILTRKDKSMANEEKRVYYTFDFNNDEIYKFEADVEDCYVPEIKPSKKSDKINKLNKDFLVP